MEAELVQLDEGVVANLPANVTLMLEGKPMTQAAIHATLTSAVATFKLPAAIYEQFKAAVAARLGITVATRSFQKALKAAIKLQFGSQSPLLASFGIPTDKPLSASSTQKVVAAAKRSQTRTVRGTKGKKQKAALTVVGNPPVSVASDGSLTISPPPVNLPAAAGAGSSTTGGSAPEAK
jgi:hypothetical protein